MSDGIHREMLTNFSLHEQGNFRVSTQLCSSQSFSISTITGFKMGECSLHTSELVMSYQVMREDKRQNLCQTKID